jgi:heme/copper-type cytochrome/quinol oxidase subunit 2
MEINIQQLKNLLIAEHQRDIKLMWIGYSVIGGIALIVLGLILWLFVSLNVSFTGATESLTNETSNVPSYVKIVFPIAILLAIGYAVWGFMKLKRRPQDIEELIKHLDNGTRVISITESKNYRVKIPLIFVNYHTGVVQLFGIVLEGVNKPFILPVPFQYGDAVKDLLNENS